MTHEPECIWLEPDCTECERLRAAYQRGRVDAANAHADAWLASRGDSRAVQRVRDLHRLNQPTEDCDPECWACEVPYPCPTIRALDGEQV